MHIKASYRIQIDKKVHELDKIEHELTKRYIEFGGRWSPKNCTSKFKIAIIIPYRDRMDNLKVFLSNVHPFLMDQNISYGVYLIEPSPSLTFSKLV